MVIKFGLAQAVPCPALRTRACTWRLPAQYLEPLIQKRGLRGQLLHSVFDPLVHSPFSSHAFDYPLHRDPEFKFHCLPNSHPVSDWLLPRTRVPVPVSPYFHLEST